MTGTRPIALPAWSPDGATIYFVSKRTGPYEVFSVPAAGGAAVQVTTGSRVVARPAVPPDGASIAWARTASGNWTEVVRLEFGGGSPAFAPLP